MTACLLMIAAVATGRAQTAGVKYAVSQPDSYLLAITGKSGLFGFAGHRHGVLATKFSADINLKPADLPNSTVSLTIPVSALVIDSDEARKKAELGSGPSANDVRTIQQRMLGPEVLDAQRYPQIRFVTTAVEPEGPDRLRVTGTFEMHGQSRPVTVPMRYRRLPSGALEFSGDFVIRQTAFGMKPETIAGGTVKVKDEIAVRLRIVVTAQP